MAISAFTSLQHVQILPVQDQQDSQLLSYLRAHRTQLVELKWAPACLHSTKTIVAALLSSRSPCSRFSSPMLNPSSAITLSEQPTKTFSQTSNFATLAERLSCLELHFDDDGLDSRMRELSGLFKIVFTSA